MPQLSRIYQKLFGSAAGSGQIGKFGSLAAGSPATTTDPAQMQSLSQWDSGWYGAIVGPNAPAIEDMNAAFYVAFYQLAYLFQEGIPEYNATTEYYVGSIVQDGTGVIYVSLTGTGGSPNVGNALSSAVNWQRGLSNSSLANMADQRIKGNVSGVSGAPSDLTAQQVRNMIYSARTSQVFTSGSGTYTLPANCKAIRVRMVGGGSGGKGSSGNATAGASTAGNASTFSGGGLTLTAGGGGAVANNIQGYGAGGSITISGSGYIDLGSVSGSSGATGGPYTNATSIGCVGGMGGSSAFGGGGVGGNSQTSIATGGNGLAGSAYGAGGGGGGQGALNNSYPGGGGGAGGYIDVLIPAPGSTYSYAVGAGGAGSAGSGSLAGSGGSGAGGAIIVEEFYL